MKQFKRIRLILGDQLNASHSWYREVDNSALYLIAELPQETSYVKHHVQKVCAFFAAMEQFAQALSQAGHQVCYMTLDETCHYADLPALINALLTKHQSQIFEYQQPDELRLSAQLISFDLPSGVVRHQVSSEHFLLSHEELFTHFSPSKHHRLESFYRKMRKRFNILMDDRGPLGGQWNFDQENRQKLKPVDIENLPVPLTFANDVSHILKRLDKHQVSFFGKAEPELLWPVTRKQSIALLNFFCQHCLANFGRFQDAMTAKSEHKWSLYHSRLSFALNSKMISPAQVISVAIDAFNQNQHKISLAQVEGFIRQILGWREYVRGIYWVNGDSYSNTNALNATRKLPNWFWSGKTQMRCQQQAIEQSLAYGYANHIQRLMVTGNFALIAGIEPDEVDAWYLGIYVDAIEWVEQPNTRGMALFADGGLIATKPYAASGNYINKMSDYCRECTYDVKDKTSDNSCPLNSLYWHFLQRHKTRFEHNPRTALTYKSWNRQSVEQQQAILSRAEYLLENLDAL
ncbi:cryptochrome/photolyase family protein [Shewanella sp. WXL01]|uniref:cryptochrome/photolyase family protein n=1 Tax=Shewanella sp. WXL01 TaxID=2709721 RepID=UPI00143864FC|nr:cryptochrome/photolyase family protein [Shewanella sp. WXL01]NKF52727.1 cryptochrome/photolyase family protein [Shewanella sp. WXL01]